MTNNARILLVLLTAICGVAVLYFTAGKTHRSNMEPVSTAPPQHAAKTDRQDAAVTSPVQDRKKQTRPPVPTLTLGTLVSGSSPEVPLAASRLPELNSLAGNPTAPVNTHPGPATDVSQQIDDRVYVVRQGDTLSSIAARKLGSAGRWTQIAQANPGVDPGHLRVGQMLRLPLTKTAKSTQRGRIHVVRAGDTLHALARQYYRDGEMWRLIYQANREVIGPDPAVIRTGMSLTIPAENTEVR